MAWRLVRALETQRAQVRKAAPRAAPPATPASSWGTIGDTQHDSTSDHSPHTYAALGSTPVVCAADYPHAPALGLDFGVFAETWRLSRDRRIRYVIFAGRIFSGHMVNGIPAFTWRKYTGSDGHYTHGHVSVVHTALADDTTPWQMPGGSTGGTTMTLTDADILAVADAVVQWATVKGPLVGGADHIGARINLATMSAKLDALTVSATADAQRDAAALAAINAIAAQIKAGNGSIEIAPVIEAVNAVRADTAQVFAELEVRIAELEVERDALNARLAEAYRAQQSG